MLKRISLIINYCLWTCGFGYMKAIWIYEYMNMNRLYEATIKLHLIMGKLPFIFTNIIYIIRVSSNQSELPTSASFFYSFFDLAWYTTWRSTLGRVDKNLSFFISILLNYWLQASHGWLGYTRTIWVTEKLNFF